MLGSSKLICFVATQDPDAAKAFYRGVLGLRLVEDGPFALVFDANGTMLRVQKVQEHTPAKHTSLGWQVADIRTAIAALAASGVRVQRYDRLQQDEAGVWHAPSGALVAWFQDPDGNTLSLAQWPQTAHSPGLRRES